MKIYLICGYRGTGKDTLCGQLLGIKEIEFNWTIYRPRNAKILFPSFSQGQVRRVAFADELRGQVMKKLQLPSTFDPQANKNSIIDGKTFRQHLIERGMEARQEDPDYWCKLAFKAMVNDDQIVVTDWRFPNEKNYCDRQFPNSVVTIRVFRPEVPIPPENEPSERSLDDIKTDFLLLASTTGLSEEELFTRAIEQFPQYRGYVKY